MRIPIFFALIPLVFAAGCSRQQGSVGARAATTAETPPLEVAVRPVEVRQVEKTISVTGSLHPDETVNLSAEVAGTLARVYADFGQNVRRGQLVAELDRRELALQAERARAALQQALARVGLDPGQEEAALTSTPAIRQAQAQYEDARFKYESAERLVKSGDISRERHTELEKTLRAREAALEAARDELRTQLAVIAGLRAELKLAEKRLGDATVRAPFDGAVTGRLASPGQYLKENTPIVTIVKASPLRLRVEVPESAVSELRVGTSLSFTTDAAPGKSFHAVVRELNPALDARSRSLTAEARLVEADGVLKPGMFVQVRLIVARDARVVMVPKGALYNVAGLTKVFVIREGKAIERRVVPGQQLEDWVEIPGGLQAGDRVAVSNLAALIDGAKVRIRG
ncbi:MAG: efflux RND transporter periplasmic adaptor subunit [Bryobacterales bacterium]|nr:efflux RND transporter periplasmic adaptor subunit [Bryobacterales bacterium]